uniref:Uncharacterized protein n=1 Tax=Ditylenchus dipsaci TaxID=166011 RepID=A0A915E1V7_9BILA
MNEILAAIFFFRTLWVTVEAVTFLSLDRLSISDLYFYIPLLCFANRHNGNNSYAEKINCAWCLLFHYRSSGVRYPLVWDYSCASSYQGTISRSKRNPTSKPKYMAKICGEYHTFSDWDIIWGLVLIDKHMIFNCVSFVVPYAVLCVQANMGSQVNITLNF